MPGFLSSRPKWVPPIPHPQASVAPLPRWSKGWDTLARGRGVGEPSSDDGTDTLVLLYISYNHSSVKTAFWQGLSRNQRDSLRADLVTFFTEGAGKPCNLTSLYLQLAPARKIQVSAHQPAFAHLLRLSWSGLLFRDDILTCIVIVSVYASDTITIDLSLSALISWFMK